MDKIESTATKTKNIPDDDARRWEERTRLNERCQPLDDVQFGESFSEDEDAAQDCAFGCDADEKIAIARRGETAAANYLQRQGYTILEQNWSCLYGEADIICETEEGDCIVFVEVKTRSGIGKGLPEEAVTPKKRMKYERIAACYLQSFAHRESRLRFDVISILALSNDYAILRHFVNAFGVA